MLRLDLPPAKVSIMRMLAALAFIALLFSPAPLASHEPPKGSSITIVGHVVDTACYLTHAAQGQKHVECATECAKEGIPLAILDKDSSTLYLPLASKHHKHANAELMPFIEKSVKVKGVVMERNGMKALLIEKIEAAP